MSFRAFTTGIIAIALLATATATFAQGPRGPMGGRGPMGPLDMFGGGLPLRGLDLTEAQRTQIRDVRERYQQETRALAARLTQAREQQRAAIEAIPADEGLITSATQALAQVEIDAAIHAARLNTEFWSVLTAEQQAQAQKIRAERQARMAERRARLQERQQERQNRTR